MPRRARDPLDSDALKAWLAAVQVRKAIQNRIVLAFRKQIQGAGPAPAESDLLLFARAAVAEQRLQSRLARSKALRAGDPGQKGALLKIKWVAQREG
jgi:hypothetical protein